MTPEQNLASLQRAAEVYSLKTEQEAIARSQPYELELMQTTWWNEYCYRIRSQSGLVGR